MLKNILTIMITILTNCFFSILSGFLIYLTLILIKQLWINTFHYFLTFVLLPPVALVITNVISNNFALSLGMIGALSIVRFRNPVKNPLELVLYFGLITIGVSYGVNNKWGFLLSGIFLSVIIFGKLFEYFCKKFNLGNLFQYSFSTNDGIGKNLIEIETKEEIDFLKNHDALIYFSIKDNTYFYKLATSSKDQINQIKDEAINTYKIKNIDVQYNN